MNKPVTDKFPEPRDPFAPPYFLALVRLKATFPLWLWRRCNEAIRDTSSGKLRVSRTNLVLVLSAALRDLGSYPVRPTTLLKPLNPIAALRTVLQDAPKDVVRRKDPASWDPSYLEKLFDALNTVIDKRGLGEAGWETIRWEVYDKVSVFC